MPYQQVARFNDAVGNRYHIYNSLFLNLPFQGIARTGTLLPLFVQHCEEGFAASKSPGEIIESFFQDYTGAIRQEDRSALFFDMIRYVERQVVLFDSVEDAAFEEMHDIRGAGTVNGLLLRARAEQREEALLKKLTDFSVRVVLTAHPTQFYPGAVLAILTDLEQAIRGNDLPQINLLLQQLGKTRFFKQTKPTPFDEALSLTWYLENIFYQSVTQIILRLCAGLQVDPQSWTNTRLFTIGFWPGGDRDGNPFVTNEITLQVATHLRDRIIRNYFNEVRRLKRRLTFRGVDEIIARIEQRLLLNLQGKPGAYVTPDELYADLDEARRILVEQHGGLFVNLADEVLLKIRIFGFHFAGIEIRQHADRHAAMWRSAIGAALWDAADESERIGLVMNAAAPAFAEQQLQEDAGVFSTIRRVQELSGMQGCDRYIISNCGSALDVIAVFRLAQHFTATPAGLHLDVIPLFESIDDLAHAGQVMRDLYSIESYREHLRRRGDKQVIMLGFSDGTKDGGYLRANWSIFRAKEDLTRISKEAGVTAIFFDGRGGPPARGGGNTHDFYASLGPTIESQEIQITIQGQTISSNFGRVNSCTYNLEQLLSAGIENAVFTPREPFSEQDKQLMDELAQAGYEAYLALRNHPDFVAYLQEVTPLPYFGDTNIGSRPVKRSAQAELKLEDLRAIPFVGSWAQMKQNIPGFYGVGTALEKLSADGKSSRLRDLFRRSLFFRTLLGNSMMSLTKTFYPATAHLKNDARFGPIWNRMFEEFNRSRDQLLAVSESRQLMENSPAGRASIRLRERMVLPLITLQQYALQQARSGKEADETTRKMIIRCMFGIINAARNSA